MKKIYPKAAMCQKRTFNQVLIIVNGTMGVSDKIFSDSLFSFDGCFNRAQYWKSFLIALLLFFIAISPVLFYSILVPTPEFTENFATDGYFGKLEAHSNIKFYIFFCLSLPLLIIPVWIHAAATVKRYHDLNKSGYNYFLVGIPILGWWQIIECGFFDSVFHKNRFRF